MEIVIPLLLIAVMVAFNALYVAAEFATVGSRRSRIQESAEAGNATAQGLLNILKDPKKLDTYVAACQIGITISSLVAGAYGQGQLTPLLEPALGSVGGRAVAILIVLISITSVQVVLGELLPKTIALRYPEKLALGTLVPMRISQWLFKPLIMIFNGSAFAILKMFKGDSEHSHTHVHSPDELAGLYRASAQGGMIDASEREMLSGVLNVQNRSIREIMTPRRRLTMVDGSMSCADAISQLAGQAHSRIPVQGEGDEIIGIVNLRDLYVQSKINPNKLVSEISREVVVLPEMANVPNLWLKLKNEERHCCLVVNEFGSIVGMATMEDAIEEIFGEVFDEFDEEEEPIIIQGNKISLRGDVLLENIKDRFEINIEADGIDTIGGYVWSVLERVPEAGDVVSVEELGINIFVDEVDETEVSRVSFILPKEDKSSDGDEK